MSEVVATPLKNKKIAKAGPGRQVRLWVRAKFLSFKRYQLSYSDLKLPRTSTKPSSDLKESMIANLLNITSERELHIFIKLTQEKPRTDSEYIWFYKDNLGSYQSWTWKQWSCNCKICYQSSIKSYWIYS